MWPSTLSCLNTLLCELTNSRPFPGGLVSAILLLIGQNTHSHLPPQLQFAGKHLTLQCTLNHGVIVEGRFGGHPFPGTCREKNRDKGSAQFLSIICQCNIYQAGNVQCLISKGDTVQTQLQYFSEHILQAPHLWRPFCHIQSLAPCISHLQSSPHMHNHASKKIQ